ncbi:MAG: alpha/beta fold hydrolase [Candidatus Rokubacteria bacterium]|nr:alpha/beta fold hydrolase [Candidatus Rokubacteria bacterium]MBI3826031.1 alpha/beta fold hydrolase [Candidatus Rokubacteria bacterium]
MPTSREFVLVHGMSHGAWCWDEVVTRLRRDGHRAVAMDLPGHGRRAAERGRASLEGYAQAVVGATVDAGFSHAIVVGHSMGGMVIQRAAELMPARIAHLVFLAAVVLPRGASLLEGSHIALPGRALMRGLAAAGGGAVQYPAAFAWARWMSDLAPGDARVTAALARLTPQPLRPLVERGDYARFWALDIPRTYIRCLRDAAVVPDRAAEYAARLGVAPIDMDCAHGPMLSEPEALIAIFEKMTAV